MLRGYIKLYLEHTLQVADALVTNCYFTSLSGNPVPWSLMRRSKVAMFKFSYSVTRDFEYRYFTHVTIVLGIIWLAFITTVNVIAVAYEVLPFTTTSFNDTVVLWYEKLIPGSFRPASRSCASSVIPVRTGSISSAVQTDFGRSCYQSGIFSIYVKRF